MGDVDERQMAVNVVLSVRLRNCICQDSFNRNGHILHERVIFALFQLDRLLIRQVNPTVGLPLELEKLFDVLSSGIDLIVRIVSFAEVCFGFSSY